MQMNMVEFPIINQIIQWERLLRFNAKMEQWLRVKAPFCRALRAAHGIYQFPNVFKYRAPQQPNQ